MKKRPRYLILTSLGSLLMSFSLLFNHLFPISDFVHGFLIGFGIVLMIGGLFLARRTGLSSCQQQSAAPKS